jgi:hypothetical protein
MDGRREEMTALKDNKEHTCNTCAYFKSHEHGGMCLYNDEAAPDIDCPDDPTPCRRWRHPDEVKMADLSAWLGI